MATTKTKENKNHQMRVWETNTPLTSPTKANIPTIGTVTVIDDSKNAAAYIKNNVTDKLLALRKFR